MKKNLVFSLTLVAIVLGALLALSLRTQQTYLPILPTTNPRELAVLIKDLQDSNKNLREEIKSLRGRITQYEEQLSTGKGAIQALNEQLQSLKVLTGLTPVVGAGIEVVLNDIGVKAPSPELQSLYLIHDYDLLQLVNELKVAGAEAIAINGQRLSFYSTIRCVGNVIQINGVPVASPFRIQAIGDPEVLEGGLKTPGGILDLLGSSGIKIKVERKPQLLLPPFAGRTQLRFAQPAGGV